MKKEIRIVPREAPAIPSGRRTKIVTAGNIIETTICDHLNGDSPIVVISKEEYVIKATGEIKTREHHNSRLENKARLKRSMADFRAVVNANTQNPAQTRFITLTYAFQDGKPMTDWDRLWLDYKHFWEKFKRKYPTADRYQYAVECQRSGNLHIHAIIEFTDSPPFIDNNLTLAPMWGHGFTQIQAVDDCDNIGAYLSAYVSNDPDSADGHGAEKGKRLEYVPVGKRIYRWSRNSFKPITETVTYEKAMEKVGSAKQTYSTTFDLVEADTGKVINTITKSYFNTKRRT